MGVPNYDRSEVLSSFASYRVSTYNIHVSVKTTSAPLIVRIVVDTTILRTVIYYVPIIKERNKKPNKIKSK